VSPRVPPTCELYDPLRTDARRLLSEPVIDTESLRRKPLLHAIEIGPRDGMRSRAPLPGELNVKRFLSDLDPLQ
jgi:hypothetical protein